MSLRIQLEQNIAEARRQAFDGNSKFVKAAEATSKQNKVIDFKTDKTGGPLTFLLGRAEPLRSRIMKDKGFTACWVKRLLPLFFDWIKEKNIIQKFLILISYKQYFSLYIQYTHFGIREYIPEEEKLSQPEKEISRVLKDYVDNKIREIICFILEFEMAYRYRVQDILSEINYITLRIKPRKEILRLLDILIEREHYKDTMAKKWIMIKGLFNIILILNPNLLKLIQKILTEINPLEVMFSKEDIYWTNQYVDYSFRGLTTKERSEDNIKKYGKYQVEYDLIMN